MTIYMVEYCDYDMSHIDSVWSSYEDAGIRVLNNVAAGIPDNYEIVEFILDDPKGTGLREYHFPHRNFKD